MLPCHSCYIYGTWRSKEVGSLKSSYGGNSGDTHWGVTFTWRVDPSASLSELRSLDVKLGL